MAATGGTGGKAGMDCVTVTVAVVPAGAFTPAAAVGVTVGAAAGAVAIAAGVGTGGIAGISNTVGARLAAPTVVVIGVIVSSGTATGVTTVTAVACGIVGTCTGT